MFLSDFQPIICNLPKDIDYADIYFIHDGHYGAELFNEKKWKALKSKIQNDDRAYVCWIGDLMENAIPNSKSDKMYKLRIFGDTKRMESTGFYL